jgi:hypothetical protein
VDERSQVVSARIPAPLAARLVRAAAELGVRPSDVVREALEAYFTHGTVRECVVAQTGHRITILRYEGGYETENPVVTDHDVTFAPTTVALGGS